MVKVDDDAEVFISYAFRDRRRVLRLADHLERAGVSIWLDQRRIKGAAKWAAEIVHAIEACKAMILVCTDESMRSWAVAQEIQLAGEHGKALLPLVLEKTSFPAQMKFFLSGIQWIEVLDRPARLWLPSLLRALEHIGVQVKEGAVTGELNERLVEPVQLEWSYQGLRSMARFTNQVWPFSADRTSPRSAFATRGLGGSQEGIEHAFRLGSRICIAIELHQEGNLILLDNGPEGKIYCLCPSHFARDSHLPKGISILPQTHSPYDAFTLSGSPGREELLAIVTDEPLEVPWLPSDLGTPALVLDQGAIDDLLSKLRELPPGAWTALGTFFDVVA